LISHPTSSSALRFLPVIVFLSVALIYLATLTWDYYWDGITFALQIEKVAQVRLESRCFFIRIIFSTTRSAILRTAP
jgi:hypothetical protein